jgi:flagellar motor switch protein FliM
MPPPSATPVVYDFRRPNKFTREHVRALQIASETFARQFTTVLSTTLRTVSQVQAQGIHQLTYDEYIRDVPNPTYLAILSLAPLAGASIFHLPLPVVMTAVDRLLGGPGAGPALHRPLTEIEQSLMRDLLGRVLRELAYAFESLTALEPTVLHQESNPQFAQIGSPSRVEANADSVRESLASRMGAAPVTVSVSFPPVTLALSDIVDLRPGDVLPLEHRVDDPLEVSIGGLPRFAARPGRRGKRLACVITSVAAKETA